MRIKTNELILILGLVAAPFLCLYGQDSSIRNLADSEAQKQEIVSIQKPEENQPPAGEFSSVAGGSQEADNQEAPLKPEIEGKSPVAEKTVTREEIESGLKVEHEGISLDLKGIELTEFFKIISARMGVTIVVSKGVSGRANVFLNNLAFNDALEVILISQELACEKSGKVINIMTAAEYEKLYGKKYNEKRKFKNIQLKYAKPASVFSALSQIKSEVGKIIVDEATGILFLLDTEDKLELMEQTVKIIDRPLETEVFDLKYAKASEIKAQISGVITSGAGELLIDERTNRVTVSDLPDKIKRIRSLIKAFDAETPQVLIEAEIVQVILNREYKRGVDWEKVFSQAKLKDLDLIGKFPVSPVLSTYQKVSIGKLSRDGYTLALNLIKIYGDTKILSRPRITALNNQEARIMVGSREAYVSQTLSQGQSTTVSSESIQFIDVGVKLKVVPVISRDGFITMNIKPEVSSVRETVTTALGSRIPIVETSEAETSVKVRNGAMIMIAGLMKEEKRNETSGFPFLSRIPFIGAIFGTHTGKNENTELIIFITPHIITGDSDFLEIEKYIPADIVPPDLQDSIIARKIKDVFGERPRAGGGDGAVEIPRPAKSGEIGVDIQEKMKGMK